MDFTKPYITKNFIAHPDGTASTRVSMVVFLKDEFTDKEPLGKIDVRINEGEIKPIKNVSGLNIFTDLAIGIYTLSIESDVYFPHVNQKVDTSKIKDVALEFFSTGPAKGTTDTRLKDASKLENDDMIELHNRIGELEQRKITKIVGNKTIFWDEKLKYDFSTKGSTIRIPKYLINEITLKPKPSYPFPNGATLVRGLIVDTKNKPVGNARITVENKIDTISDFSGEFILYFREISGPIEIKINGNPMSDKVTLEKGKTINLGKNPIP